ncbi:MAG: N-acetyltransferase [Geminicoccaceae bacterium]|nr:MAG: N-acetyltransferase [Geminicoccaceae bacterium]
MIGTGKGHGVHAEPVAGEAFADVRIEPLNHPLLKGQTIAAASVDTYAVRTIYLRALAVRQDQQGRGLGTALMIDAMRRGLAIADRMGDAAIVRDVLTGAQAVRRWAFTTQLGFRPLGDPNNPNRAFLPVADARATLG